MDAALANSQASLAQKQFALSHKLGFQGLDPALGQKEIHLEATELAKLTEDLKDAQESRIPLADPIAQIQQKKIQLLVAERQYTLAERQIRLVQGQVITNLENGQENLHGRSVLGRQNDLRNTEELQKAAQPLLTEASDLLKKARHTVTFAELDARQKALRRNSLQQRNGNVSPPVAEDAPDYSPWTVRHKDKDHHQIPTEFTNDPVGQDNPSYVSNEQDTAPKSPSPPPMMVVDMGGEEANANGNGLINIPPGHTHLLVEKKKKSNCCCISVVVILIIALLVGGGLYALHALDVIKF